jgi:recombination protein RecA
VDKKGAWYTYGEEKLGQGRENVKITLEQNPELAAELEAKVRKIFFPPKDLAKSAETPLPAVQAGPNPSTSTIPSVGSTASQGSAAKISGRPSGSAPASGPMATQNGKAGIRSPAVPAEDDDGGLF